MFEHGVGRIGDALASLVAAIDPDAFSVQTASALWAGLDRVERLAAAGKTVLARRAAQTAGGPDGSRRSGQSGVEELARRAGTGVGAVRDSVTTSQRLVDLPILDAALRAGELSPAQAHLIASAATADPSAQERLVALAPRVSLPELRDECARVRAAADPDPEARNARLRAGRRLRRYTDPEGAWNLSARGAPQAGALFNAALDSIIDECFAAARPGGRREAYEAHAFDALMVMARRATDPAGAEPPATPRRSPAHDSGAGRPAGQGAPADAPSRDDGRLGAVPRGEVILGDAREYAHSTAGTVGDAAPEEGPGNDRAPSGPGGQRAPASSEDGAREDGPGGHGASTPAPGLGAGVVPEGTTRRPGGDVSAGADEQPWHELPESVVPALSRPRRPNQRHLALMRVDLEALRRGAVEGDELCEIAGVGPVPVSVARGLLGDAVLKLVITRGVDVLNVTHLGRGPTAAQRVALAWTNPGCSVEGCWRTRVEIDHREDWGRTRHTRLDELDHLCAFHHDLKTRLGWAFVSGTGKRAFVRLDDPRHPRHRCGTAGDHADESAPPSGPGAAGGASGGGSASGLKDPVTGMSKGDPPPPPRGRAA